MTQILLVGCGKMGRALLDGWKKQPENDIVVVNPSKKEAPKGVTWLSCSTQIDHSYRPEAVVFAIKPQVMAEVVPLYARFSKSLYLSIAAGKSPRSLASLLSNDKAAIVRAMPNLTVSVGKGVSVAVASEYTSQHHKNIAEGLLGAVGKMAWIEEEALMNAVTALSGSGPAYVFALIEAMAASGEALGLDPALSMMLARETLIGSGSLLDLSTQSATDLRLAVTSPAGTTEAALEHLLAGNGLEPLMKKTMQAAAARAEELAS